MSLTLVAHLPMEAVYLVKNNLIFHTLQIVSASLQLLKK